MVFFSAAHSPKSISLQRLQQNGLNKLSSVHGTNLAQVGQLTTFFCVIERLPNQGIFDVVFLFAFQLFPEIVHYPIHHLLRLIVYSLEFE